MHHSQLRYLFLMLYYLVEVIKEIMDIFCSVLQKQHCGHLFGFPRNNNVFISLKLFLMLYSQKPNERRMPFIFSLELHEIFTLELCVFFSIQWYYLFQTDNHFLPPESPLIVVRSHCGCLQNIIMIIRLHTVK